MSGDALELVRRRVLVISLVTWLPLLVLSALEGHFLGGDVAVPFLRDWDAHARFLLALPLLIGAELVVHERMRHVVNQFRERSADSRERVETGSRAPSRRRSACATRCWPRCS